MKKKVTTICVCEAFSFGHSPIDIIYIRICTCVFHSSSMSQQRRAAEENESPEYGSDDV